MIQKETGTTLLHKYIGRVIDKIEQFCRAIFERFGRISSDKSSVINSLVQYL